MSAVRGLRAFLLHRCPTLSGRAETLRHTTRVPYVPSNMALYRTLFNAYRHIGAIKVSHGLWLAGVALYRKLTTHTHTHG